VNGGALNTVLIGFGRVAAGYAADARTAACYPYITHAQVLRDHPAFNLSAAVDPAPAARESARDDWHVNTVADDLADLPDPDSYHVAVLASPPESRPDVLAALPNLKAIVLEKPLALNLSDATAFAAACAARDIAVQVNLPRRADETMVALAEGGLAERIGRVQAAFGLYGNGLSNNGTHLVDTVRMLLGEIRSVQAVGGVRPFFEGPITGDFNLPFTLVLESGICVMVQPLGFDHYREVGLDLWGETGRLGIWHEGLTTVLSERADYRSMTDEREIASDHVAGARTTIGHALYNIYDNLTAALDGKAALRSDMANALRTMTVVEAVRDSVDNGGTVVRP